MYVCMYACHVMDGLSMYAFYWYWVHAWRYLVFTGRPGHAMPEEQLLQLPTCCRLNFKGSLEEEREKHRLADREERERDVVKVIYRYVIERSFQATVDPPENKVVFATLL